MIKSLLFGFISLAACGICSASTLTLTATGTFSSTDSADSIVTPGDTFSLSFAVPSNPVTNGTNSTSVTFDVPVTSFSYALNGTAAPGSLPTEITFYTAADGGGFAVQFASAEFIFSSSQLFSGTTAAPVFTAGTFSNQNFTFLDNSNVDSNSSTITLTSATTTATPEPSSVLFLLCGGICLLAVGVRKSVFVR